jgi:hypothetical protein
MTWENFWNKECKDNKLYKLKKNVTRWKDIDLLNRKDATTITRLRIGHTRMTHDYKFDNINEAPKCICKETVTVEHLFNCTHNRKLKFKLKVDYKDLAKEKFEDMMRIIKFIKELGLYFKI